MLLVDPGSGGAGIWIPLRGVVDVRGTFRPYQVQPEPVVRWRAICGASLLIDSGSWRGRIRYRVWQSSQLLGACLAPNPSLSRCPACSEGQR
jgi:hypothetical protein